MYSEIKENILKFLEKNPKSIIILRWTTATWKTDLSLKLVNDFNFEIISADSRQIFKYMDIWTDKVDKKIREKIPHHQIDIINPDQHYTAWQRQKDTKEIIWQIFKKNKIPLIVWWTGLYIDTIYKNFNLPNIAPDYQLRNQLYQIEQNKKWSLYQKLQKIDPLEASKMHPNSTRYIVRALEMYYKTWIPKSQLVKEQEVDYPILMLGLRRDIKDNEQRIYNRVLNMIKIWLIQEVEFLLNKWYNEDLQSMQWIWYKQTIQYLKWFIDKKELITQIVRATTRYAKKQRTWLRRYIKDSKENPKKNVQYSIFYLS